MATTRPKGLKPRSLRVVEFRFRDVLGLREGRVEPGKITVFEGPNRAGKTTHIEALEAGLAPRLRLATLSLRPQPGEEPAEPEVVVVLDGPDGAQYRVERGPDDVRVLERVRGADGQPSAAFKAVETPPGEFLASLRDAAACNPVGFITASGKERVKAFLAALPVEYDRGKLIAMMEAAAGGPLDLPSAFPREHPLLDMARLRGTVFRERTGVNRDLRTKSEAAEALERDVPAGEPPDVGAEVAVAQGERDTTARMLAAAEERAAADERHRLAAIVRAEAAARDADAAYSHALLSARDAEAKFQAAVATETAARAVAQKANAEAEAARRVPKPDVSPLAKRREALTALDARLAGLRERERQAVAARTRRDDAARFRREADEIRRQATRLTAAIEALDAHQREMLASLPFEGLAVDGEEVTLRGVPLEQLNHEQLVDLAVRLAEQRAKRYPLPLIVVDHAEALDVDRFNAMADRLAKTGCQLFAERHTDEPGPLRVVTR